MRLPVRALALLLLACNPTKTDDTSPEGDTDVGDLSDLDWRLHQDVQSLVYVSWSQSAAATVHVEYDFEEGERLETPSFEAEAGTHEQLVLGVPFGTDAEWSVVLEGGVSADGETITTGPLPNGLLVPTVHVNETDQQLASGNYLLSSINVDGGWNDGNFWTFILDRQGRAVWASLAPRRHWTLFAQVAASGDHILWDEATYWSNVGLGEESKVHRTWLDSEIDVIDTPGLHHAFVQLPDGTLAWGSKAHGGVEALVEKALDGEDETVIWTCRDDWEGSGHCESNGIFYSADRDSFLYSFYTNDSVVEVDHATGASVWWAGSVRGGYSFDPSESEFSWQHGISYTDAGTLLMSTDARSGSGGETTQAVEYQVDHDQQTLTRIWSFDPGVSSGTNGDAWRLDNGNTLHLVGASGHLYEVTAESEIVWHLEYGGKRLLGRGELIEDLYALVEDQGRQ